MDEAQTPQRTFLAITMVTVLAVAMVFMVYAALLATYIGSPITVTEPGGQLEYSLSNTSNSSWTSTLDPIYNGTSWYARLNITNSGAQDVTIKWTIIKDASPLDNPFNTTITLTAGSNTIYSCSSGKFADLYDWGSTYTTTAGSYKIEAKVYG